MNKEREHRAPSADALAQVLAPFAPAGLRPSTQPRLAASDRAAQASIPPAVATGRPPASSVSPEASTLEPTTTKRPSAPDRPEPFRIGGTEELQASATVPVVAAAINTTPPPRQSRRIWLVVVLGLLLLGGSATAAYFLFLRDGEARRPPEHPPTGGLAGSARPDLPEPGPASADALVALAPGPDAAAAVPPVAPDASTPPPPPPPPPDAGPAEAAVETAVRAEGATARPDAGASREAVEGARPDAGAAREGAPEAAARDAARDVVPPEDEGAAAPEEAVEARAAQPTVEDVARVFLRLVEQAARCAEGEGPGEFRVSASVRGSDGRVRDVTVTTGFSDHARQCVQNLAAGMHFPPFGDETASFEHTFTVSGEADAGTGDGGVSIAQEVRRILRRAAPRARACLPGVEGAVVLLVRVDGTVQTATLVSVEGAVTAEQQECLRGVVEATEVPAYPGTWTVPLTLQ